MTKPKLNFFAIIGGLMVIVPGITYALSGSTPVWGIVAIEAGVALLVVVGPYQ